jgi:hypothetical protein
MSRVLEVQDRLRETVDVIARLEKSLAIHRSPATAASLRSLYKLHHVYEEEFRDAAAVECVDVVNFRLFEGAKHFTVALVGGAMSSLQTLYSVLYSVVSSGKPKDTSRLSAEAVLNTALEFAYAKPGSVDLVFTMPNERLLLGETDLDTAMGDLFLLARSNSIDQIKSLAQRFGLAPVRALYKWTSVLAASEVGAEIQWRKNEDVKAHLLLQPAEIAELQRLIDSTSDLEVDTNDFSGILHGFDDKRLTFAFQPTDGARMIRGTISESANLPPEVTIPKPYTAKIRTTTKVRYATEQPEVSHELLGLVRRKPQAKT